MHLYEKNGGESWGDYTRPAAAVSVLTAQPGGKGANLPPRLALQ